MDNRFDKLEQKLDKLDQHLDNVDKTLIVQEANLRDHMRRSDLLEKKMVPIENHVNRITWAVRGILWFCATAGSVLVTLKHLGII